jgi:hypothetical protein
MSMKHLRILAGVLAVGGIAWGLFCLPLLLDFDSPLKLLLFGPGYLVTAGYLVRCLGRPSLTWRRSIWGASALIQGAWLASLVGQTIARRGFFGNLNATALSILGGWWLFGFSASVYGFLYEPAEPAT